MNIFDPLICQTSKVFKGALFSSCEYCKQTESDRQINFELFTKCEDKIQNVPEQPVERERDNKPFTRTSQGLKYVAASNQHLFHYY